MQKHIQIYLFLIAWIFTLGNFSDSRSHRFCISGIKPCNPEFEILHQYPVSCASVSKKSVSETLCAVQKSRQSFNRPHPEFFGLLCCSFLAAFISLCTYIRTSTMLFQRHSLHICSQKNARTDGWVVNEIQTEIFENPYAHTIPPSLFFAAPSQLLNDFHG